MGLGCKVHNCIDFLCNQEVVDKISAGNVGLDEFKVSGGERRAQVFEAGTVVKLIEGYDLVIGVVLDEAVGYVGGYEAGCTGYEDVFQLVWIHWSRHLSSFTCLIDALSLDHHKTYFSTKVNLIIQTNSVVNKVGKKAY